MSIYLGVGYLDNGIARLNVNINRETNMQISIETTQGLERKMTIGVPAADVDGQVVVALKSMVKGRKIDGFRQGKIPPNVAL